MLNKGRTSPPGSVLIIEDDNTLREVLIELLSLSNVSCFGTYSGGEGIELFVGHQRDIDLVVMDMGLQDKNGAEIVQTLQAIRPDVEIIIISGRDKKGLEQLFAAYPYVSVMQKPFNTFRFLDTVNNRLDYLSCIKSGITKNNNERPTLLS